jgi:hypothetical protein
MSQSGESQVDLKPQGSEAVTARSSVWPMIAGLVAAGLALEFVCLWLQPGTLPRSGLIVLAVLLLFTSVMVCGLVVRWICRKGAPDRGSVATPVMRAACLTALWIPAWVLSVETWSPLMLVAACACLASLGIFLKRCEVDVAAPGPETQPGLTGVLFQFEPGAFRRMILPSFLVALLVEAAIILVVASWFTMASLVAGASVAVLGWRATSKAKAGTEQQAAVSDSRQGSLVVAALIFTMIALLPYLKLPLVGGLGALLRTKNALKNSDGAQKPEGGNSDEGYTGIILLSLTDEHKRIVAPVKRELIPNFGVRIAQELEIPFNGAYWYFKYPDKAPRPSAKVVRGDAAKVTVHSTDRFPLLMEAHQRLDDPIDLGCCSAMNLVVRNADRREGAIVLELWVRKRGTPATALHYLGTETVPSSEQPLATRAMDAPEESLRFPIPPSMNGIEFDEITVVMRAAPSRATVGAQVGLRKFVLEP